MTSPTPSLLQRIGDAALREESLGHTLTAVVLRDAAARIAELESKVEDLQWESYGEDL